MGLGPRLGRCPQGPRRLRGEGSFLCTRWGRAVCGQWPPSQVSGVPSVSHTSPQGCFWVWRRSAFSVQCLPGPARAQRRQPGACWTVLRGQSEQRGPRATEVVAPHSVSTVAICLQGSEAGQGTASGCSPYHPKFLVEREMHAVLGSADTGTPAALGYRWTLGEWSGADSGAMTLGDRTWSHTEMAMKRSCRPREGHRAQQHSAEEVKEMLCPHRVWAGRVDAQQC